MSEEHRMIDEAMACVELGEDVDPMNAPGMDRLADVPLSTDHGRMLRRASEGSGGPAHWRQRKLDAARDVLALARIAPRGRLCVKQLSLAEDIEMLVEMDVPVASFSPEAAEPMVSNGALIAVRYPQEVLGGECRGDAFVRIHKPRAVWHPAVDPEFGRLCLAGKLPRSVELFEVVWLTYATLAMQDVTVGDWSDDGGILNLEAARWWTMNSDRMPLTRTALLEDRPV